MNDQQLVCRDCGKTFIWTKGEQEFYQKKGFQNAPTRCPDCRKKKKDQDRNVGPRQMFEITCSKCGKKDSVPFKPSDGREVLCRDCFRSSKGMANA